MLSSVGAAVGAAPELDDVGAGLAAGSSAVQPDTAAATRTALPIATARLRPEPHDAAIVPRMAATPPITTAEARRRRSVAEPRRAVHDRSETVIPRLRA